MDGNKDDALKCLKIGKDAMEAGDRSRALKFLEKARRLDPSLPIDDLISDLNKQSDESAAEDSPGSIASESPKPSDRPSLRQRGSSSAAAGSSSLSFTEEQRAIVREIKSKKDYYEILGVTNSCSVEDLRKAYRKLSLKVHPDKNKAPGSEEAFKSVSKAFQCLGNEETRRKYDISGSDEPVYQPRRAARTHNGFNGFYDDEFDADEIFRSFCWTNFIGSCEEKLCKPIKQWHSKLNGSIRFSPKLVELLHSCREDLLVTTCSSPMINGVFSHLEEKKGEKENTEKKQKQNKKTLCNRFSQTISPVSFFSRVLFVDYWFDWSITSSSWVDYNCCILGSLFAFQTVTYTGE